MERLKSIPLWTGVASLIYIIAKNWFGFEIPAWADISTLIIAILANVYGLANNPTDKEGF